MLLQGVNSRLIVIILSHLLRNGLQLQRLNLERHLGSHEVVSVALVALRELDLINFVLYHHFAGEEVVQRADIRVNVSKCARLLYQTVLSVEIIIESSSVEGAHVMVKSAATSPSEGERLPCVAGAGRRCCGSSKCN